MIPAPAMNSKNRPRSAFDSATSAISGTRFGLLLINTGLLALVVLAAAAGSQLRIRFPRIPASWFSVDYDIFGGQPEGSFLGPETSADGPVQYESSSWPMIVLITIVLVTAAFFVARYYRKRRGGWRDLKIVPESVFEEPPEIDRFEAADLVNAVELAQRRMAEARDPSDAVVAGWVAFEEVAGTRGWVREPHETTTEFTTRLLARSPTPAAPVATLRGLYQQVRFGGRRPSVADVAAAQGALVEIAGNVDQIPEMSNYDPQSDSAQAKTSNPTSPMPAKSPGVTRNRWGED